jgi:hypothetical protein
MQRIGIIGSGNVASCLVRLFAEHQLPLVELYARNTDKGQQLCQKHQIRFVSSPTDLQAELLILCVTDQAIAPLLDQIPAGRFVVYTAGAPDLAHFNYPNLGVFYPYQSISAQRPLAASKIPFLLEAKTTQGLKTLEALALSLGAPSYLCTSHDRLRYHLAAVFVNNFGNLLLLEAQCILKDAQLEPNALTLLLQETLDKALAIGPEQAQTGPALRNDGPTMQAHRALLKHEQQLLYDCLSQRIQERFRT